MDEISPLHSREHGVWKNQYLAPHCDHDLDFFLSATSFNEVFQQLKMVCVWPVMIHLKHKAFDICTKSTSPNAP